MTCGASIWRCISGTELSHCSGFTLVCANPSMRQAGKRTLMVTSVYRLRRSSKTQLLSIAFLKLLRRMM